jgi:hypothetical protein
MCVVAGGHWEPQLMEISSLLATQTIRLYYHPLIKINVSHMIQMNAVINFAVDHIAMSYSAILD